jgi:hypothetical protein
MSLNEALKKVLKTTKLLGVKNAQSLAVSLGVQIIRKLFARRGLRDLQNP